MKVTTKSPANIAFIKYWGRKDHKLFLPMNNNISMTMSGCITTTTIELSDDSEDKVYVKYLGKEYVNLKKDTIKANDLYKQIERIRDLSGKKKKYIKMKSENNFPSDAGIASSASSFSGITGALLIAYGLNELYEDKIEFSKQVRLCGSASAIRSVYGGFVEMYAGHDHESSYAVQLADENHWDLIDIVAVVDPEKKKIETSKGHEIAETSPYFKTRILEMQSRVSDCRKAIIEKNLELLGQCIEEDSLSMHLIMMTQRPSLKYWSAGSISIMKQVENWREKEGILAYTSFDAGSNPHIICKKKDFKEIEKRLLANPYVKWTIYNEPCKGTEVIDNHLF